jgi:type I restriction enzyme M protein
VDLLASHQGQLARHLSQLEVRLANDNRNISKLAQVLADFAKTTADPVALAAVREKLGDEHGITDELLLAYRDEAKKAAAHAGSWQHSLDQAQGEANKLLKALAKLNDDSTFDERKVLHAKVEAINPALKAGLMALEARHKTWLKLFDLAEKTLRPRQWAAFDGEAARDAKKALLPRDVKKREKPTVRDLVVEAFKRASYFIAQLHWLLSRFPSGQYEDVSGLCKAVGRGEIEGNDYSLTPGRYVGAAAGSLLDDDGEAFKTRMKEIHADLADLNSTASLLAARIQIALAEMIE